MKSFVCKACQHSCKSSGGLTRHQNKCNKQDEQDQQNLHKLELRNRDLDRAVKAKAHKRARTETNIIPEFVQGSSSDGNRSVADTLDIQAADDGLITEHEFDSQHESWRMDVDDYISVDQSAITGSNSSPGSTDISALRSESISQHNSSIPIRVDDDEEEDSNLVALSLRPRRTIRFPEFRYRDLLPSQPTALPNLIPQPIRRRIPERAVQREPEPLQSSEDDESADAPLLPLLVTEPNDSGVFREYDSLPSTFPDEWRTLESLDDAARRSAHKGREPIRFVADQEVRVRDVRDDANPYGPYPDATNYLLMQWYLTGSLQKSAGELEKLVHGVLLNPDYNNASLQNFSASRQLKLLDNYQATVREDSVLSPADGWLQKSVRIPMPLARKTNPSEAGTKHFNVEKLHYRKLTSVIKSTLTDPASRDFHYTPFREMWQRNSDTPPERLFGEMYTSDVYLEEHAKLQQRRPANCIMEWVILALMFWSDATRLANFGSASLWPIYLFFGNQTKYDRAKPSAAVCEHIAYIPSLGDDFASFYLEQYGVKPTDDVKTFSKRELFHAVWDILFDEDFVHAMHHGMVIECSDGVTRRVFPLPMTYSADYPEKIAIVGTKQMARYPCPRCYVLKVRIPQMGSIVDMHTREEAQREDDNARQYDIERMRESIFVSGVSVANKDIATYLEYGSRVPVRNAFSKVLSPLNLNYHSMVVPDLMHEFELGVWKSIFIHLMRLLHAAKGNAIVKLNTRYRLVPTYGRGTIRRIANDASAMKKLAARDFEDLLQTAFPVFELLFEEPYNKVILDLIFTLSTWHAYAKLRLHTDSTISELRKVTIFLGREIRQFKTKVCGDFATRELPKEQAARARRKARTVLLNPQNSAHASESEATLGPAKKEFNMELIKLHFLGDYHAHIKRYGSSDSYSTQTGELEHRRVKKFYARTNKVQATQQIAMHEKRQRIIRKIAGEGPEEPTPSPISPDVHYSISAGSRTHLNILLWLKENKGDPALKDFVVGLKDHILSRLTNQDYNGVDGIFSTKERNELVIIRNCIYVHLTMRLNYTTYDFRRDQDNLNTRTHADIMLLSPTRLASVSETMDGGSSSEVHPYVYARVIKILHIIVQHIPEGTGNDFPVEKRMDVLWVRRYRRDLQQRQAGFHEKRLHRLEFHDLNDREGYGFVDPDQVIRASYIVPAFAYGKAEKEQRSVANLENLGKEADWSKFYVIPFVDRDMFMRYVGGGVGHNVYNRISNERMVETTLEALEDDTEILNRLTREAEETFADANAAEELDDIDSESEEEILVEGEEELDSGDEDLYLY